MKEGNISKAFFFFHYSIKSIVYSFCIKQKHFRLFKKKSSLLRIRLAWQECSYLLITFLKVRILYSPLVMCSVQLLSHVQLFATP